MLNKRYIKANNNKNNKGKDNIVKTGLPWFLPQPGFLIP